VRKLWLWCCALLLVPGIANALQDLPLPKEAHRELAISGYIDGSYNYLLNSNQFTSGSYDRVFDINQNGFTLQQAAITFARAPHEGFGGLLNIVAGKDANILEPVGWNAAMFGSPQLGLVVPQAYLQYTTANNFNLKVGELVTLAGIELYDYTRDTNFSRSILDGFAQPGINVGIRGTKFFADRWKVIVGINNGWSTIEQIAKQKILELGFGYKQPDLFTVAINFYNGQQYLTGDVWSRQTSWRSLVDIYATLYVNPKLSFASNFDYAMQSQALLPNGSIAHAMWIGIAGYVNYIFSDKWRTSIRVEKFDDTDGYRTGVRQNWREVTLTLAYLPIKEIEVRAETRRDFSNQNSFFQKNKFNTSVNQQSFALEMFYKFDT
jgi:hypothetical protein